MHKNQEMCVEYFQEKNYFRFTKSNVWLCSF